LDKQCTLQPDMKICVDGPKPNGPQPQLPGTPANCKQHYFVEAGQNCWVLSQMFNISLDAFYRMNPAVDNKCSNLPSNVWVCVRI